MRDRGFELSDGLFVSKKLARVAGGFDDHVTGGAGKLDVIVDFDFDQLDPIYDRIQELIAADQPYTFLAETERLVGVNVRVQGAVFNAASPYFNLEDWYVQVARER